MSVTGKLHVYLLTLRVTKIEQRTVEILKLTIKSKRVM